jgi:hypothetical protein
MSDQMFGTNGVADVVALEVSTVQAAAEVPVVDAVPEAAEFISVVANAMAEDEAVAARVIEGYHAKKAVIDQALVEAQALAAAEKMRIAAIEQQAHDFQLLELVTRSSEDVELSSTALDAAVSDFSARRIMHGDLLSQVGAFLAKDQVAAVSTQVRMPEDPRIEALEKYQGISVQLSQAQAEIVRLQGFERAFNETCEMLKKAQADLAANRTQSVPEPK